MRQWIGVPAQVLCQPHLLGEHCEHHMFIGTLQKGINITGYLTNNLLEPLSLYDRHEEIRLEMIRRNMSHLTHINKPVLMRLLQTNLTEEELNWKINQEEARAELMRRCPDCKERYREWLNVESKNTMNFQDE